MDSKDRHKIYRVSREEGGFTLPVGAAKDMNQKLKAFLESRGLGSKQLPWNHPDRRAADQQKGDR